MGVLPLQFADGQGVDSLGLDGHEVYDVEEVADGARTTMVTARRDDGAEVQFEGTVRIDTPQEWLYFRHGGILQYVLRQLLHRNGG
jgi:aconitate hydratase